MNEGKVTINAGGQPIEIITIREEPGRWVIETRTARVTGYLIDWPTGDDDPPGEPTEGE